MHFIKFLKFAAFILLSLTACEQTSKENTSRAMADTIAIYQRISANVCNCTLTAMRNNKPSVSLDSCYKAVVKVYNDSLKNLGFDPATTAGQLKLSNEVIGKFYFNCADLSNLLQKETDDENEKKLLFKGSFVSQKKLPNGEYEVIMKDNKTKANKVFKSKNPFDENSIKDYLPGYEVTLEYEVNHNIKTNKDEYYLKENGAVSSIGAVEVKKK